MQKSRSAPAVREGAGERVVLTIGHSTRATEEFIGLLTAHGVRCLVDVRTMPGSRRNPQFNAEALREALRTRGIGYEHLRGLGGLRKPRPDSVNSGWRNRSFRGYADHMASEEFKGDLQKLADVAANEPVAVMCAEAVPWRCHRSLLADALLVRGFEVEEIVTATRRQPHRLTPFAVVAGDEITYPPTDKSADAERAQQELFSGPDDASGIAATSRRSAPGQRRQRAKEVR
jgi:hypothetical protein